MRSDLVERIRGWQATQTEYDPEPWDLLCYAADRIEELERENEWLRRLLVPLGQPTLAEDVDRRVLDEHYRADR